MTKQFTKLTDSQWAAISDLFLKRKRKNELRSVLDGILYILRTGVQWRNLPSEYPKWTGVYYYFDKWTKDSTLEKLNIHLNMLDREGEQRASKPSLLCIDSQSIKLSPMLNKDRGIDGNKKVNGRKRQCLVDTSGRLWCVLVHAANIADGKGALPLLKKLDAFNERLELFLGDTSYNAIFAESVRKVGYKYEKAARLDEVDAKEGKPKGFVPEARRWVVERTLAWTNFFRRVTKDYERNVESAQSWMLLANITIMLQRIIDS